MQPLACASNKDAKCLSHGLISIPDDFHPRTPAAKALCLKTLECLSTRHPTNCHLAASLIAATPLKKMFFREQVPFCIRTVQRCYSVHVCGSWDYYKGRLPLSQVGDGLTWKGTFRIPRSDLSPNQQYYYYYELNCLDRCHDKDRQTTFEHETRVTLNVLNTASIGRLSDSIEVQRPGRPRDGIVGFFDRPSITTCDVHCPQPVRPNTLLRLITRLWLVNHGELGSGYIDEAALGW